MTRRSLFQRLAVTALGILFPWYRTAKAWPFVEVDPSNLPVYQSPESESWGAQCEWCASFQTDLDDDAKFYRTTDDAGLIVCEHCTGEYLKG